MLYEQIDEYESLIKADYTYWYLKKSNSTFILIIDCDSEMKNSNKNAVPLPQSPQDMSSGPTNQYQ